jgi:hypothetical protein
MVREKRDAARTKQAQPAAPASAAWAAPTNTDYEKLGAFYLGRPYDVDAKKPQPGLLLYDSKDLVTHAVAVGMTGSGKTGLCIALIEEAAIDGIPTIAIDPKGDLTNLLLTFPELRPQDFRPWINEDDARQGALSPDDFAAQQATLWANGLAAWGEDGSRIKRLKDAADFAIYTPGSNAGIPVSILASFAAPAPAIRDDNELLQERVSSTATSLLGLLGIDADPVKSREHILLSNLFAKAWASGTDLDLATLIAQIQAPPMETVGVLDLETFFPSKERYGLATRLNNLLAAPGFASWLSGESLDIAKILHGDGGKPRVAVFSIAHLSDAERMFFVSLLLNQVLSWVRTQTGTTSLRAVLYMDEIFGYFPPVATPPSKLPLLTLLKQARAFGLGVVLATQNPVDLDYKGLANTGTWFLGRLQTERDKGRVLEGLEGAAAAANAQFDKAKIGEILSALGNRVFLMNNVHEDAPVVFETRWAMSYLRGPLTREQIKTLMTGRRPVSPERAAAPIAATANTGAGATAANASGRPSVPPDVPQQFVPARGGSAGSTLVYRPRLLARAKVRFTDAKRGIDATNDVQYLAPIGDGPLAIGWDKAEAVTFPLADLEKEPQSGAAFEPLPPAASKAKNYAGWKSDFAAWVYRIATLDLKQASREQRDALVENLRAEYAPKVQRLEEKIRTAQQGVDRESGQARAAQIQTAVSVGATVLGALLGRKRMSATTLGRATTAARGVGRSIQQQQDIGRAKEDVASAQAELAALNAELEQRTGDLSGVAIRPTKSNIDVQALTLAWAPYWRDVDGDLAPAWA